MEMIVGEASKLVLVEGGCNSRGQVGQCRVVERLEGKGKCYKERA